MNPVDKITALVLMLACSSAIAVEIPATKPQKGTIHRWIKAGKIRAVKLSAKCTRIDGDSLADFLSANAVSQKQPPFAK